MTTQRRYTDAQKKLLLDLIEKWQKKLRLLHWRIEVDWDEAADEHSILSVSPNPERHCARICVGGFFDPTFTDAERENAVAHELIHCHVEPLWNTIEGILNELGLQAHTRMESILTAQVETMIDALATSFVPLD